MRKLKFKLPWSSIKDDCSWDIKIVKNVYAKWIGQGHIHKIKNWYKGS